MADWAILISIIAMASATSINALNFSRESRYIKKMYMKKGYDKGYKQGLKEGADLLNEWTKK